MEKVEANEGERHELGVTVTWLRIRQRVGKVLFESGGKNMGKIMILVVLLLLRV